MAGQKYASWAAEDTRESSGLPSDFDSTIVAAQFTKEPPDGYNLPQGSDPIFGWLTHLIDDGGEYAGKTEQERTLKVPYSVGAGAGKEFDISEDGFGLIPKDTNVAAIRKGSKFDMMKCTLENEGVPKAITQAGTLEAIVGLRGHWRRVEDEKLLGKKREFNDKDEKKKKFPDQTLVMVKLLSLPGQQGKAAPATKSAPAANASAPAGATAVPQGDLETRTGYFLREVLNGEKSKSVQRSQLVARLSKAALAETDRAAIAKLGSDEAFITKLSAEGMVIGNDFFQTTYDPKVTPQVVGIAG